MDFFDSRIIKCQYVCHEVIRMISIFTSSDKIIIESGNVDNVTLSYMECPGKHEYVLVEEGQTVSLQRKHITSFIWALYQPFLDSAIKVTVPVGFNGGLVIKTSSGKTVISNINSEKINVECSSGAIKIDTVNAGRLDLSTSSGAIKLENVYSGSDISAGCSSGMISMINTTVAKDISAGSHSGVIRLVRVGAGGSVVAGNKSGAIHIDALKTGGNIDLSTMSGAIIGSVAGKETDYSITSHTTSGYNGLRNSQGGPKMLNANAKSGAIKISFLG